MKKFAPAMPMALVLVMLMRWTFTPVTLCHASPSGAGGSGPARSYELITVDNQGQLNGHTNHPNDIIPAPVGGCPLIASSTPTPTPANTQVPTATPSAIEPTASETATTEPASTETQEAVPTETVEIPICLACRTPLPTEGQHGADHPQPTATGVPHGVTSGLNFQPGACAPWPGVVEAKEIGTGNTLMVWVVNEGDCWSGYRFFWTSFSCSRVDVWFTPDGGKPIQLRVLNNWLCWSQTNVIEIDW